MSPKRDSVERGQVAEQGKSAEVHGGVESERVRASSFGAAPEGWNCRMRVLRKRSQTAARAELLPVK